MYKTKNLLLISLISLLSFSQLIGQITGTAGATVKVQIKKGLTIQSDGNDLDFGENILSTSNETYTISPENGVRFEVTGHPGKQIDVDFDDQDALTNNQWGK